MVIIGWGEGMKIIIPRYRSKSRNITAYKHWRSYQRERDEIADLVWGYTDHKTRFDGKKQVHVKIIAYYKSYPVDASNIDDKAYVDALMKSKIIPDDNPYINPMVIKQVVTGSADNHVEIIVKEI